MTYTGEMEGEVVQVYVCHDGTIAFRCDLLNGKYTSEEALAKAIKAKKLKLRKSFSNPCAYLTPYNCNGVVPVTVTCLDEDGSIWVARKDGTRSKERSDAVYESREETQSAVDEQARLSDQIKTTWDAVKRWQPNHIKENA